MAAFWANIKAEAQQARIAAAQAQAEAQQFTLEHLLGDYADHLSRKAVDPMPTCAASSSVSSWSHGLQAQLPANQVNFGER